MTCALMEKVQEFQRNRRFKVACEALDKQVQIEGQRVTKLRAKFDPLKEQIKTISEKAKAVLVERNKQIELADKLLIEINEFIKLLEETDAEIVTIQSMNKNSRERTDSIAKVDIKIKDEVIPKYNAIIEKLHILHDTNSKSWAERITSCLKCTMALLKKAKEPTATSTEALETTPETTSAAENNVVEPLFGSFPETEDDSDTVDSENKDLA